LSRRGSRPCATIRSPKGGGEGGRKEKEESEGGGGGGGKRRRKEQEEREGNECVRKEEEQKDIEMHVRCQPQPQTTFTATTATTEYPTNHVHGTYVFTVVGTEIHKHVKERQMGGVGTGGAGIDVQDETCSTGGPVTLPQFTSQDTVLRDKDARGHVSRGYLGVEKVDKVDKVEKVEKVKGERQAKGVSK